MAINSSLNCQLETLTTCRAAIIVRYSLQCIMGNYTVATRNTPCRQISTIYKSKSRSKHSHFRRHGAYCLSCNSQNTIFAPLKWPAFRPALFCLTQSQTKFRSVCTKGHPWNRQLSQTFSSSNAACQFSDRQAWMMSFDRHQNRYFNDDLPLTRY